MWQINTHTHTCVFTLEQDYSACILYSLSLLLCHKHIQTYYTHSSPGKITALSFPSSLTHTHTRINKVPEIYCLISFNICIYEFHFGEVCWPDCAGSWFIQTNHNLQSLIPMGNCLINLFSSYALFVYLFCGTNAHCILSMIMNTHYGWA